MTTRVQHRRSSVAGNIPGPSDLQVGELGINFADRYIFTKTGAAAVVRLSGHIPLVQPASQVVGDSYINPVTGKLFTYFDFNGAGEAWNEIAPPEDTDAFIRHDGSVEMTGPLELFGSASGNQAIGFTQVGLVIAGALAGYLKADGSVAMTGLLTLSGDPVSDLQAATKQYVDDAVDIATPDLSAFLAKAGGVMTGQITLPGGGTGNQAVTANEISAAISAHVALTDPHTQYATIIEAQVNAYPQATLVAGTVDAIELTFTPALAAYTTNMRFRWRSAGANTIVAPTINIGGAGAKTIKRNGGAALLVGDTGAAGYINEAIYNGTDVILLDPARTLDDTAHTYTTTQTFNGPVVRGTTTLTDAATIAWDLAVGGPNYKVTLAGNRVLGAFTNGVAGQEGFLTVIEDASGGRTLDLSNAVYDFFGPSVENIARGANEETLYYFKVISSSAMYLKRWGATSIREGGRDFLKEETASASATIDFVLTKWLALYDRFEVDFDQVAPATDNTELWLRTSTDAGVTYDGDEGRYEYASHRMRASSDDSTSDTDATAFKIIHNNASLGMGNAAGETAAGTVTIFSPSVAQRTKLFSEAIFMSPSTKAIHIQTAGFHDISADVDAIRFLASTGNITSGTFRLYGVRK